MVLSVQQPAAAAVKTLPIYNLCDVSSFRLPSDIQFRHVICCSVLCCEQQRSCSIKYTLRACHLRSAPANATYFYYIVYTNKPQQVHKAHDTTRHDTHAWKCSSCMHQWLSMLMALELVRAFARAHLSKHTVHTSRAERIKHTQKPRKKKQPFRQWLVCVYLRGRNDPPAKTEAHTPSACDVYYFNWHLTNNNITVCGCSVDIRSTQPGQSASQSRTWRRVRTHLTLLCVAAAASRAVFRRWSLRTTTHNKSVSRAVRRIYVSVCVCVFVCANDRTARATRGRPLCLHAHGQWYILMARERTSSNSSSHHVGWGAPNVCVCRLSVCDVCVCTLEKSTNCQAMMIVFDGYYSAIENWFRICCGSVFATATECTQFGQQQQTKRPDNTKLQDGSTVKPLSGGRFRVRPRDCA